MIPPSTIWCAATFCPVQARRASGSPSVVFITSGRGMRDHFPLRVTDFTLLVSVFSRTENESTTLDISRLSSPTRAVSFWRCVIWSCVRDIFLYNDPRIIQNYDKNQGYIRTSSEKSKGVYWASFSHRPKSFYYYSCSLLRFTSFYYWRILYWE